ncbi:hypothetical protein ACSQ67_004322 [Phaseolus vulgaris]
MHSHFLAANRAMMPAETAWYQTPIYMPTFLRHHHKKIVGANSVDGSRRITIARPEGGGLKTVTTGREVPIHCSEVRISGIGPSVSFCTLLSKFKFRTGQSQMIAWMKNSEKMFDKFSFGDIIGSEDTDKKHESVKKATTNKKADSDSKEEENDHLQKERHLKQEEFAPGLILLRLEYSHPVAHQTIIALHQAIAVLSAKIAKNGIQSRQIALHCSSTASIECFCVVFVHAS